VCSEVEEGTKPHQSSFFSFVIKFAHTWNRISLLCTLLPSNLTALNTENQYMDLQRKIRRRRRRHTQTHKQKKRVSSLIKEDEDGDRIWRWIELSFCGDVLVLKLLFM
jgi:hypothetical protein